MHKANHIKFDCQSKFENDRIFIPPLLSLAEENDE